MDADRRRSLATGVLFLLTFATSIPGALLYGPLLGDPDFVRGHTGSGSVLAGALLEIALVIANLGTALLLYPALRRTTPSLALAYVVARVMESTLIAVGILSLLTVVTLQQAGASEAALPVAQALVALHAWTFLLGPGFVVGLGNGLILGCALHRSGLVPRGWAVLGMVAGPLVSLSGVAVLLGAYSQVSPWSALLTLPEVVWELFLGVYLTVHGFRRTADATPASPEPVRAPATS
jgi:hypothetical protein